MATPNKTVPQLKFGKTNHIVVPEITEDVCTVGVEIIAHYREDGEHATKTWYQRNVIPAGVLGTKRMEGHLIFGDRQGEKHQRFSLGSKDQLMMLWDVDLNKGTVRAVAEPFNGIEPTGYEILMVTTLVGDPLP